jgi:hypothetical protein
VNFTRCRHSGPVVTAHSSLGGIGHFVGFVAAELAYAVLTARPPTAAPASAAPLTEPVTRASAD